jgi:hypothetical protein
VDWIFVVGLRSIPLTPALSPRGERGKGSRSVCFSKSELDSGIAKGRGEREQIYMLFKI